MRDLVQTAKRVRLAVLEMAHRSGAPHCGSALSCVDALVQLYFVQMRLRPKDPTWPDRDRLVFSKGHGAMALYATLAEAGALCPDALRGFLCDDGELPGHLDRFACPGVEVSAGSLGHGLPMGLGLAHGLRLRGLDSRVYVLMGDGETQEGSVWEAAMKAPVFGLDNLVVLIDGNNLQGYGRPCRIMHFEPLAEKWQAFGWTAVEADGHDFASLQGAFDAPHEGRPKAIILRTVKGKGVSFMEDEQKWHYFILTDPLYDAAKNELLHA